eukprot:268688-Chlamydomonas_euryale.AAC.1
MSPSAVTREEETKPRTLNPTPYGGRWYSHECVWNVWLNVCRVWLNGEDPLRTACLGKHSHLTPRAPHLEQRVARGRVPAHRHRQLSFRERFKKRHGCRAAERLVDNPCIPDTRRAKLQCAKSVEGKNTLAVRKRTHMWVRQGFGADSLWGGRSVGRTGCRAHIVWGGQAVGQTECGADRLWGRQSAGRV